MNTGPRAVKALSTSLLSIPCSEDLLLIESGSANKGAEYRRWAAKALVVYDSTYGHTEKIAQAIGEAMGGRVLRVGEVNPADLKRFDLLIVGSPTHGGWRTPPRVFPVNDNWLSEVSVTQRGVKWRVPEALRAGHWETLPDGNVILLSSVDGILTRFEGSLAVQGRYLHLKQSVPGTSRSFERGALYDPLIAGMRRLR